MGTDVREYESRRIAVRHREYALRRRRQALSTIPVGVLGLALVVGGGSPFGLAESSVLVIVGVVVLGFFGYSLGNWRCPECSAYLGQRLNPRKCPACGDSLRD